MRVENGYYIWNKGDVYHLGQFFTTKEFECQCDYSACKEQRISITLIDKLSRIRALTNSAIIVTSGFRCPLHQHDLTNSPGVETVAQSTHELGNASDIKTAATEAQLATEFKAIGIAARWFHVDLRADKIRRWYYK